jgi:non-specific serine/threonine protein kinase/serine/threonine-protein kinase
VNPARWAQVNAVFAEAVELPAEGRAAFLTTACAGDAALRVEVEALLASDAQASGFLETPAVAPREAVGPGSRIGSWQLEALIGRGGMGSVWAARRVDGAYQQKAALKLVRAGLDDDVLGKRFLAERQILARLEHPRIARLLDGGTTAEGAPWLAMEYVDGERIDAFCATRRLSTEARLRLFLEVCQAVSYAHHHLVVHRDLKPANVLVKPDGTPMLLDFGIARLLDAAGRSAASELTRQSGHAMTPAYASPEQIRGEPVSTASDVFSLGVVLFQMLTGRVPFGASAVSPESVVKAVLDEEPERPSKVVPAAHLAADLDSVILKALEKDPARRYASVDLLAEDLRRFLGGQPVEAFAATFLYRAAKLVRRNRALSVALGLFVASLGAGIAATSWQAHVASRERAKAEKRFGEMRSMSNALIFEVHDAIQYLPGATEARARVTKKAVEYLDELSADAPGDASLVRELAAGYQKVAEAQSYSAFANLGDAAGAERNYEKALGLLEAQSAKSSASAEDRGALAGVRGSYGLYLLEQGQVTRALLSVRSALGLRRALFAEAPADLDRERAAANAESHLGDVLTESGDLPGALSAYEHVRETYTTLLKGDPASARNRWGLIAGEANCADVLQKMNEPARAREALVRALALNEKLAVDKPGHYSVLQGFGILHQGLGELSHEAGDFAGARASYERARQVRQALCDKDPNDVEAAVLLAKTRAALGLVLVELKDELKGFEQLDAAAAALDAAREKQATIRLAAARVEVLLERAAAEKAAGRDACGSARVARDGLSALVTPFPRLASLVALEARAKTALAGCQGP